MFLNNSKAKINKIICNGNKCDFVYSNGIRQEANLIPNKGQPPSSDTICQLNTIRCSHGLGPTPAIEICNSDGSFSYIKCRQCFLEGADNQFANPPFPIVCEYPVF